MKKKNVLRLLAFVMAASLTLTSAPAGLLSGTETVYAADEKLTADNFSISSTGITVKAAYTTGKDFLLVAAGQNVDIDKSQNWVTGNGAVLTLGVNGNTILEPNYSYTVYWRNTGKSADKNNSITLTTNKKSLKDAVITLAGYETTVVNDGYDTSAYSVEYNGTAQEPKVASVQLAGTNTALNASDYTVSYLYNTDAHSINDEDGVAPTVVVTGTGDYEGTAYVKFTIDPYDFSRHASSVRTTIGGVTNYGTNHAYLTYDGLQKNPDVVVEVQLDPTSTTWTKLVRDTDFEVNPDSSTNTTTHDNDYTKEGTYTQNHIDYNVDAGIVTLVLDGIGNYVSSTSGTYEIMQATPTAPTKPVLESATSYSFVINTQDEDLKYEYEYMIMDVAESTNYMWDSIQDGTHITSSAVAGGSNSKPNIVVSYSSDENTTTATPVGAAQASATGIKVMGSTSGALEAGKTYYVVRRIVSSSNNTQSQTSVVGSITLKATDINNIVSGDKAPTFKQITVNGKEDLTKTGDVFTALSGKDYDAKARNEIEATLYFESGNEAIASGYTIEYYNSYDPDNANLVTDWHEYNNSNYVINKAASGKGDRTSAGTVYVFAHGDDVHYSGYYYLGYYVINRKSVTAIVNDATKIYDSTNVVAGYEVNLTADVKTGLVGNDTVHFEKLDGVTKFADAGTQRLSSVSYNWNYSTGYNNNYDVSFNCAEAKITVNKASVSIGGDSTVNVAFGETVNLRGKGYITTISGSDRTVASLNTGLTYTLNDSDNSLKGKLTLNKTTGELTLLDYDALKDAGTIKITVRYATSDPKANDNYTINDYDGKEITVTLSKAPTVVYYEDAKVIADTITKYGWNDLSNQFVKFPSYTRPSVIRAVVENQSGNYLNIAGISTAAGIDHNYYSGQTNGTTPTTYEYSIRYVYTTATGTVLKNNEIPSLDGTYYVYAYIDPVGDEAEKNIDGSKFAGKLTLVIGGTNGGTGDITETAPSNPNDTISDNSVSTGYKVEDGKVYTAGDDILVRSRFVTITTGDLTGVIVYANKNGVMVHGKSFKAADGYWHYANEDGSVITEAGVQDTDNGNKVYCYGDNNGRLLVSGSKKADDGNKYVANTKGILVKNGFTTTKKGYKYYVENYVVAQNKKFTYTKNGKTYIATKTGTIAQGAKVVKFNGKKYYVYAKGSVAKSTTVKYKGKTYVASKTGVLTKKTK